MDKNRRFINDLIYASCDGKPSDMKVLQDSTYMEFCGIIDSYLEKVERNNKEIKKMQKEIKSGKRSNG